MSDIPRYGDLIPSSEVAAKNRYLHEEITVLQRQLSAAEMLRRELWKFLKGADMDQAIQTQLKKKRRKR